MVNLRSWPTAVIFLAPEHLFWFQFGYLVKKMLSISGKQALRKLKLNSNFVLIRTKPRNKSHSLIFEHICNLDLESTEYIRACSESHSVFDALSETLNKLMSFLGEDHVWAFWV